MPVWLLMSRAAERVQGMFEYRAGRDVGEPVPLAIFRREELVEVED